MHIQHAPLGLGTSRTSSSPPPPPHIPLTSPPDKTQESPPPGLPSHSQGLSLSGLTARSLHCSLPVSLTASGLPPPPPHTNHTHTRARARASTHARTPPPLPPPLPSSAADAAAFVSPHPHMPLPHSMTGTRHDHPDPNNPASGPATHAATSGTCGRFAPAAVRRPRHPPYMGCAQVNWQSRAMDKGRQ